MVRPKYSIHPGVCPNQVSEASAWRGDDKESMIRLTNLTPTGVRPSMLALRLAWSTDMS